MSSNRFKTQIAIEKEIGCVDPAQLALNKGHFKQKILNINVSSELLVDLEAAAVSDSSDIYFKALLSIVEALEGISQGAHSWAIVKLYYSVFYLLRSKMAARNFVFFKCAGNIYSVKLLKGAVPQLRSVGKFYNADIRGDHKTIMATYVQDVGKSDLLNTNSIESENVFQWLMGIREDIHYRNPTFAEPQLGYFNPELFTKERLPFWIDKYLNDATLVHCFLKEHSCLATPLVLAKNTLSEFVERFRIIPLNPEQGGYLMDKLDAVSIKPDGLTRLFGNSAVA